MLPFKRGAFHLAVQAQVIPTSPSPDPQSPTSLPVLAEARHGGLRRELWADRFSPNPHLQVPIVPIVMSSYQDFYCKKERRFTSGEGSVQIWGWGWVAGKAMREARGTSPRGRHFRQCQNGEMSTRSGTVTPHQPICIYEAALCRAK